MMNIAYVGEENSLSMEEMVTIAQSYQQYRSKKYLDSYSYSTVFSHY